jgi:beta-1,4-mannooligosaccharide/beta-1,4-mannosyl-N-acetylglucosamine phosphorylase
MLNALYSSKKDVLEPNFTLPPIPWEQRPAGSSELIWRYSKNPIIKRNATGLSHAICNSAVIPFDSGFAGVFRVEDAAREFRLHQGFSKNGIDWDISQEPMAFANPYPEIKRYEEIDTRGYDPRITEIEGRYYITWCKCHNGPTVAISYTDDFKIFYHLENAFLPFNRNGVLFPKKIGGSFAILSRPSDNGHTPFGDIYFSQSPDMVHWGRHRQVMKPKHVWEITKVGAGPVPIETPDGWLLLYHGVLSNCSGFNYSMGCAILDSEEPWKIKYRCKFALLTPQAHYECVGCVPNTVFPCASLVDPATGKMAIYYGAADTVVAMAFTYIDELINYVKKNSTI